MKINNFIDLGLFPFPQPLIPNQPHSANFKIDLSFFQFLQQNIFWKFLVFISFKNYRINDPKFDLDFKNRLAGVPNNHFLFLAALPKIIFKICCVVLLKPHFYTLPLRLSAPPLSLLFR